MVHSSSENQRLFAALAYLERGWIPIPIRPKEKIPCIEWRHYQKQFPTKEEIIEWWQKWPEANVAIITGAISGIIALDIDNGADLGERPLPRTPCQRTGGGGKHYLFKHPGGNIPNRAGLLPHVDLRGDGGYIIAPPSTHPSGRTYSWILSPEQEELAPPPDWLMELIQYPAKLKDATPRKDWRKIAQGVPEGMRNTAAAAYIGKILSQCPMDQWETKGWEKLKAWNQRNRPPLDEKELRKIFESIAHRETAKYRKTAYTENIEDFAQKDYAHAQELARLFQGKYRWAAHRGKWMQWNGRVWEKVPEELVARDAAETLLKEYAKSITNSTSREELKALSTKINEICTHSRIAGALAFLKGWEGVLTNEKEWDQDPWLLNVGNGILNLRMGRLLPHNRDYLCTKLAPVDYDPTADPSRWLAHIERFLPNPNIRRQVQRDLGISLVGAVLEEALPIWYGTGANGKTTTFRVIHRVLGDYARRAVPDLLIRSKYERHPTEIADLWGARLVYSIEVDAGKHLAEALVKDLTGGDTKKARFMHQDFFEFEQTFSIILVVNHRPSISGTDEAIWRRIRLVPWEYRIPDEERRPQEEIVEELAGPAVLNWILEGLQDWQRESHWIAPEVLAATQEYRAEQDVLGAFLADCCEFGPRFSVGVAELYEAYTEWATENYEEPIGKTKMGNLLRARGIGQARGGQGKRKWIGLRLRSKGETNPSDQVVEEF